MSNYVLGSYSASLLLLFVCIMCIRMAVHNSKNISTFRNLVRLFGIVPGFAGVLFGIYMQFKLENSEAFTVMTAWILLELGAVQLLYILKKYEKDLSGAPDPVN